MGKRPPEAGSVPTMGCAIIRAGIMLSVVAMFVNVTKFLWSSLWLPLWASIDTYWKSSTKDGQPMVQEQSNELNEEEKRAAAELRMIMERVRMTPTSNPERIHFVADAFEMDMECPSLLKKVPGLHEVVIESINYFRNRSRIVYHSNTHMPIGVVIWEEFHRGEDYVDAAYRLGNTMNLLERELNRGDTSHAS